MDLLSDIFKQADVKRRILIQRTLDKESILRFPCNRSIGFHVVTKGELFLFSEDVKEAVALKKGDLVVMARGRNHYLTTQPKISVRDMKSALSLDDLDSGKSDRNRKSDAVAYFVSGAYQLWNNPIHPFFNDIPEVFILKSEDIESYGQIQSAINMLALETSAPQIGSETIVQNLLDIIFSYLIRKIVETKSNKPKTWSYAISNDSIKKVIELMHVHISRNWTLDDLAKEVGLSRAGLAQKFKKSLGDTPLHYLTKVRMQKARALLSTTDDTIEVVAEAVGYSDAFSFSKVFKKITGLPPRDFRTKDQLDRKVAFRY